MDWKGFFEDYQIEYVTRGPNVKKGNLNIACPYCGDDPSHHMGVSLSGKGYGCWRSANHVGKKPHSLIRALLNCSYNQANMIVNQYSMADPDDFDDLSKFMESENTVKKNANDHKELSFPKDFKEIKSKGSTKRFYDYIMDRGFKDPIDVCKKYSICCATTGTWKDRIIFPIFKKKKLVSWTSRALGTPKKAPRYLALSEEQGGLVNVFHTLWNLDKIRKGGKLLLIVEGPFDALKIDYYSNELGICATCTFGTSMSKEQAMILSEISKGFKKSILLYDSEATEAIFLAKSLLSHTNIECGFLPEGVEDPGEMNKKQVRKLLKEYI